MLQKVVLLLVFQFLQSSDSRLYCDSRSGVVGPGTTSYCFHAGATVPDPHSSSLHFGFATKGASVLGVLAYFDFLHHFPEGGTITGPVFTDDSDLLSAFCHVASRCKPKEFLCFLLKALVLHLNPWSTLTFVCDVRSKLRSSFCLWMPVVQCHLLKTLSFHWTAFEALVKNQVGIFAMFLTTVTVY